MIQHLIKSEHGRRSIAAAIAAVATLAGLSASLAADATPASPLQNEGEQSATPQQFRNYRSYGAVPRSNDQRSPEVRGPGPGGSVTPIRPSAGNTSSREPEPGRLDPRTIACANRFRTFNATTGTYVTADGQTRTCPYLQ